MRLFKIIGISIGIVLLLLAVVVAALPRLLSTDTIRMRVAQELSAWTGYMVQLREPPKLTLFPSPKAVLDGVLISSNEDGAAALMEAKSVEVDLSLFSALMGRVVIRETRIIKPQFNVVEPVKTVNDIFHVAAMSQGALGNAIREAQDLLKNNPATTDVSQLLGQPFGRIVVRQGRVTYRDRLNGPEESFTNFNATLDWPASNVAAQFSARGEWRGEKTDFTLHADQALLLFAHGPSPLTMSLNSRRGGITFSGRAQFSDQFFFDGQLSGRSPGWNQTLKWLGFEHHLGMGVSAPVVWESSFNAVPERLEMNNVAFTLGKDNTRGALEISFMGEQPMLSGSLAFQTLDMAGLLAIFFPDEEYSEALDLDFLDRFGVDVRLSSPQAQFYHIPLANLAAAIQIRNGRAIFDLGNADVFDGTIQSNIQIFRTDDDGRMEARIAGSRLTLSSLAQALGVPVFVDGQGNFSLSMQSPFDDSGNILHDMRGNFSAEINKGRVNGYDFTALWERVANESEIILPKRDDGSFPFDRAVMKGDIANAVAQVQNGQIIQGENRLSFSGLIPIVADDGLIYPAMGILSPRDVVLNMTKAKVDSSTTTCSTVQCLKNSLKAPLRLFIAATSERIRIKAAP